MATVERAGSGSHLFDVRLLFVKEFEHRGTVVDVGRVVRQGQTLARARQLDGPLLTKLFSGAAAQQIWLDWQALPEAIDSEQRLSILARWMLDADAAGLVWGLRIPGVELAPDHGPAQLCAGLRALALFNNGAH